MVRAFIASAALLLTVIPSGANASMTWQLAHVVAPSSAGLTSGQGFRIASMVEIPASCYHTRMFYTKTTLDRKTEAVWEVQQVQPSGCSQSASMFKCTVLSPQIGQPVPRVVTVVSAGGNGRETVPVSQKLTVSRLCPRNQSM